MSKQKIALLIDLASLRVTCDGFRKLTEEVEAKGFEIVNVKFYSYVAKRNRDFNEYVAAKGYDAVTPIASRRRNKLDTRQIIDATLIGMSSTVNAVGFAVGEGDILPIVSFLKLKGMDVVEIGVHKSPYVQEFSDYVPVKLEYLREGYAAPTSKEAPKKVKKVLTHVPTTRPIAPAAPGPEKKENQYVADVKKVLSGESILGKYKR
jgi:uncharacterized LabA/DUF88 family protein